MLQQSEVVSLLLALSLAPVIYASVSDRSFAGKRAFMFATFAMVSSYVATVLEGVTYGDLFNAVEHGALAASGVAFAIAVLQYVRSEYQASST